MKNKGSRKFSMDKEIFMSNDVQIRFIYGRINSFLQRFAWTLDRGEKIIISIITALFTYSIKESVQQYCCMTQDQKLHNQTAVTTSMLLQNLNLWLKLKKNYKRKTKDKELEYKSVVRNVCSKSKIIGVKENPRLKRTVYYLLVIYNRK